MQLRHFVIALGGVLFAMQFASLALAQTTWHVDDDNCPGPGDGSSGNPFCRVQDAIDAAVAGDLVLVEAGTYVENLTMKDQVDLVGAGATVTTIDAGGFGSAIVGANALLRGFTITNAAGLNERAINCLNGSSPRIEENVIAGNEAPGILLLRSSATILRNRIIGNPSVGLNAAPILCVQSSPVIADNFLDASDPNGNLSAIEISSLDDSMTEGFRIERNTILGRIFLSDIDTTLPLNNRVEGNLILSSNGFSEAINVASSPSAVSIVNNTLFGGSGVFLQGDASATKIIGNIIVFGNEGIDVFGGGSTPWIAFNDVFGNQTNYSGIPDQTGVNGNISSDPLFVDQATADLSLQADSPCVDAGDPASELEGTDLAGNPRVLDGDLDWKLRVDMGALEFSNVRLELTGDSVPGGTLTFHTIGTPGLVAILFVGTAPGSTRVARYGEALFDLASPFTFVVFAVIPDTRDVQIPTSLPTPLPLVLQELGFDLFGRGGNFSNAVEITIE